MPYNKKDLKAEAWARGVLAWKLHKGQEVIENAYAKATDKLFVANCARRFGKTYWAAIKCLEKALTTKGAQIYYCSAFLNDLKNFIIPTFELILEDCPSEIRPLFKFVEKKWIFGTGSEIQLIGLDKNPNKLRGNFADLVIFEEAGLMNRLDYLYSSIVLPLTQYRKNARIIMISTPPETPAHPFQDFCEIAETRNSFVKLTIYENPLLSVAEIEGIKGECLDETSFRREYLCDFVVDENRAIIKEFSQSMLQVVPRVGYYGFLHKYVGLDIGVKQDLTAILYGHYDPRGAEGKGALHIEAEDEINGPAMTTDVLSGMVKDREVMLWGTGTNDAWRPPLAYRRISDNNNPLLINDLRILHGLSFMATSKDNLHAMVNELRVFIKQGRLTVDPSCTKTAQCLQYAIWNPKRRAFAHSRALGHFDHLAALIYLVRNIDFYTDPVPAHWNTTMDENYLKIGLPSQKSGNAKAIEKALGRAG